MKQLLLRSLLVLVIALAIGSCSSSKHGFVRLSDSATDKDKVAGAQELGHKLLIGMKTAEYVVLGNEATTKLRTALSPDVQEESYTQLQDRFGDYESMEFYSAWSRPEGGHGVLYRFKGKFTHSPVEVRVVIAPSGRLSGFWVLVWHDELFLR